MVWETPPPQELPKPPQLELVWPMQGRRVKPFFWHWQMLPLLAAATLISIPRPQTPIAQILPPHLTLVTLRLPALTARQILVALVLVLQVKVPLPTEDTRTLR